MSIDLRTELYLYDSENALFKDVSGTTQPNGYGKGTNPSYGDVEGVRIKLANYSTMEDPTTISGGAEFEQFREYVKVSQTTSVINGKTFTVGTLFVPQVSGLVVPINDEWKTTGYYVPQILASWLPTASEIALNLNVTEFGQQANTPIEANIYAYTYEIYTDIETTTFAPIANQQYLVLSGSVVYDSDTYYAGEVLVTTDTSNITISTGSVAKLNATSYSYSPLIWDIEADLNTLIQNQIGKNNQDLINQTEVEINKIALKIQAIKYAAYNKNISLLYTYDSILFIQSRLTYLLAN
jgi:hypothetical protein